MFVCVSVFVCMCLFVCERVCVYMTFQAAVASQKSDQIRPVLALAIIFLSHVACGGYLQTENYLNHCC